MKKNKQNKKKKIFIYSLMIIFLSSILVVGAMKYNEVQTMKCIGENSQLFVQPGSNKCQEQTEIFGENIKYLEVTDCFSERNKCKNIEIASTPIWIVNGEEYKDLYNLNSIKELTHC